MFLTSWGLKSSEGGQKIKRKMHTYRQTDVIIIEKSTKKVKTSLCPQRFREKAPGRAQMTGEFGGCSPECHSFSVHT